MFNEVAVCEDPAIHFLLAVEKISPWNSRVSVRSVSDTNPG